MQTVNHSIHDVLSKNATSFYIPPFQRAYAWGKSEIERYFSDITKLIESEISEDKDKREHFFGTLVLKKETGSLSNKEIIVDGQQRLTTTLLFLIALRDSQQNDDNKKFIDETYLHNSSSTYQDKIKLKQVTKDWESYRALVSGDKTIPSMITSAYDVLKKNIVDYNQRNPSIDFIHYIVAVQRLNVAVIILDERPFKGEDPQIIFETLNSLGRPLTLSDLIRNYILLKYDSDNQSKTYDNVWYPKIESVLLDNTSNFFRDYLQLKLATSLKVVSDNNTKELYHTFKDYIFNSYNSNDDFIKEITRYVDCYKWIVNENFDDEVSKNSKYNSEIKELLRNIFHDIKAEAFKPLVLGLLEYNQNSEREYQISDRLLIEILQDIRTYLIRRRLVKATQGENKYFATCCRNIDSIARGDSTVLDLLTTAFYKLRMPNDNEISNQLQNLNFYSEMKKYAKFILGKIEENNTKISVDYRNPKITIEHIMPQTLEESWKESIGPNVKEVHSKYLHNIGNLILTEFNSEIGNKPFNYKVEQIKKSALSYRLSVISNSHWNETSILKHQSKMIEGFLNTFSLPEHLKQSDNWNSKQADEKYLFPQEDDALELPEWSKPIEIIIDNNIFKASTWQDVFVLFVRYFYNSSDYDFDFILENQANMFGRKLTVFKWGTVRNNIDNFNFKRFKKIDGAPAEDDMNDNDILIHIEITATTCISRIAAVIDKLLLPEDFVKIRLK